MPSSHSQVKIISLFQEGGASSSHQVLVDFLLLLQTVFKEKGWSQRQIAQKFNISQSRAHQLQSGVISSCVSLDTVVQMLHKLGYRLEVKVTV